MNRITVFAAPVVLSAALICLPAPASAQRRGHDAGQGRVDVWRTGPRGVPSRAARPFGPYGRVGYPPRAVGGFRVAAPYRFAHPFYTFRPRVHVGFGLWAGFQVPYPNYYYGSPYPYVYSPHAYAAPFAYPVPGFGYPPSGYRVPGYPVPGYSAATSYPAANYPPQGSVVVQPGQSESGGVSFEITPDTAALYVDGQYAGDVGNFVPSTAPLTLTPGRHHFEISAPGYQTMAFDADVTPGQVIPYRGTLPPVRPY